MFGGRAGIGGLVVALAVLLVSCSSGTNALKGVKPDAAGDEHLIIAEFAPKANLAGIAEIADWTERGKVLVSRLKSTAKTSQAAARRLARQAGVPATTYWILNVLELRGDSAFAQRVSKLPGVAEVYLEPLHERVADPTLTPVDVDDTTPPLWNIEATGAPRAWASGETGTGALIGVIDTGVDVTHPALRKAWRRTAGWFDATGECPSGPCDRIGHGTHVTGTAVGRAAHASPAIGVAPGASFIAAKACGGNGCLENDLLGAAQWMLAPDGHPGTRPTLLLNSWDLSSTDTSLDGLPDVWRAAGQLPVFAAGNDGPRCGTVGAPASQSGAVAVGALGRELTPDPVSSRGPGPTAAPKPDVWAPGVDIVSSIPGGGYGSGTGTSMAAPHVVGALALRLGSSKDVGRALDELLRTASPLTGPSPCPSTADRVLDAARPTPSG